MRSRAGYEVIEDRAQRIYVRSLVDGGPGRLLGCHETRRAEHRACVRVTGAGAAIGAGVESVLIVDGEIFCQTPVDDDRLAERADQNVLGLEVAVNDGLDRKSVV